MPKTETSPLAIVQKQSETIKKSIDKLVKECNKTIKNTKLKDRELKQKQLFKECFQLRRDAGAIQARAEDLDEENEPKKVKNYANKRDFEVKRLTTLINQLNGVIPKLCPEENEEEFTRKLMEEGELSDAPVSEEVDDHHEDSKTEDTKDSNSKEKKKKDKKDKKEKKKSKNEESEEKNEDVDDKESKKKEKESKKNKKDDKKKDDKKKKDKDKDVEETKSEDKNKIDESAEIKEEIEEYSEDEDRDDVDNDIDDDDYDDEEEDEESEDEENTQAIKSPPVAAQRKSISVQRQDMDETPKHDDDDDYDEEDEDVSDEEESDDENATETATKSAAIEKSPVDEILHQKKVNEDVQVVQKEKKDDNDEEEDDDLGEEEEDDDDDESGEDSDEDNDKDEEDNSEDENETLEVTQPTTRFVAIDDFDAAESGDLSVKQGEIIHIVEVREDGWWVAENDKGEKGLVPKTYLQMYNPYKDIQQQGDEDNSDSEKERDDGDDNQEKDEDGLSTPSPSKKKSGKELWGSVKKTVSETLVSDVLHAMGAGPSGFRLPTLSKYFNESEKFRMKNFLTPKLSQSNLCFRDLFFNPASGQMRPISVRIERIITITSCQQIPPPATGITVIRRYVRMCLFDGQHVLSNIHTVRVAADDRTERKWTFNSRVADNMDTQQYNEFFVRSDSINGNIGILFELCITCIKTKTEEKGEFSCGWVHLPLIEKTGLPIANKSYDLYVHGGTPYEKDVEVDPSISRRAASNALVSLMSGNKQPRLLVRVGLPTKEQKTQLELLPELFIGNSCLLPQYSYYRQILADALVVKRLDLDSTEPIHSPFLNIFPRIADSHDMMNLFREQWVTKFKTIKRAEKRDVELMKAFFEDTFMESVYPVYSNGNMVPYQSGNAEVELKRKNIIEKYLQVKRERKSALATLLASDIVYSPLDMSEVTFNVINSYSLSEPFVPVPVEG